MGFSLSYITFYATLATLCIAQAPDTLWTRTYGGSDADIGWSIHETADSGYIIAGGTTSFGAGESDVYLIKTDRNGDTIWTKTYGGTGYDAAYSVQQTIDGGYIVVGYTYSFGAGESDVYIIKTDNKGDTVWTKTYGTIRLDFGRFVQQTNDHGYIIVGIKDTVGGSDVFLLKLNANGDTLWTKTYGEAYSNVGRSVQECADGGYIIAGRKGISATNWDVWLIRTNTNGDTLWTKSYGGQGMEEGYSVQVTTDGGFIIIGYMESYSPPEAGVYLIRTNPMGDTLWTKRYNTASGDRGESVHVTSDGGYVITGYMNYDVCIIRTNEYGDTLWTKAIGGQDYDYGHSIDLTFDEGYVIVGHTLSFGGFWCDIYLIKIAPDTLGIEENQTADFYLASLEIYPNPFNEKTDIRFHVADRIHTTIEIYDATGRLVKIFLMPTVYPLMPAVVSWNGHDDSGCKLPNGVYFVTLQTEDYSVTKKLLLLR